jgi:uncharacterized membrane protein YebE (DUF533 family)
MIFMRRRPLLRAAAVGGGAYLAGKHVANRQAEQQNQEQQFSSQVPQQAPPPAPPAQVSTPSMAEQLKELVELHNAGALSDDEFAAAKSKLLES